MSLTINGTTNTLTAASGLTIAGNTAVTGTLSATGITSVTDVTDATSTTAASLKTAGGLAVAKKAYFGDTINAGKITSVITGAGYNSMSLSGSTNNALTLYVDNIGTGAANFAIQGYCIGASATANYASYFNASGSAGINYSVYSNAGIIKQLDATDSSSVSTGSINTAGGVGIAKKLYVGDNIVMASGKGIDFSATSNGSGTTASEVFDDYETGTWTPTLTFATPGDLAVTYSVQSGGYVKVGRKVTVNFVISTSAFTHTTASGALKVSGLPFTANAAVADIGAASALAQGLTAANYTNFSFYTQTSATHMVMSASAQGQSLLSITTTHMPSGTPQYLQASLTYFV
jgi:hypothetical protein